jgi:uncharacterized membrane protein
MSERVERAVDQAVSRSWTRGAYEFVKTTLIGGLVFLVPIAILAFLGMKAVHVLQRLARPLSRLLPVDTTVWGVVVADVIVVALILLACFAGGLLARLSFANQFVKKAETGVLWRIPGYGLVKALTDTIDKRAAQSAMQPVLIHFDDSSQLAFEVDRLPDGRRIVYVPSAPEPRAGSVIVMDGDRVEPVPMTFMAAVRAMRALGRGVAPFLSAPPPPPGGEST